MSFLGRIVGRGGGGGNVSPKEEQANRQDAVEKICNSLIHANLLEDRRSAAQALKSATKHYPTEIGSIGLSRIIDSIKRDWEDEELLKSLLETLVSLFGSATLAVEIRVGLCEMFLKDSETLQVIFYSLKDAVHYVKFDVLQLLMILQEHLPHRLPAAILTIPDVLSDVLDLLDDTHEIIRNETLLLLQKMTKDSAEIQRVAVFNGAIEKLFELIINEGGVFGGDIVVEDALIIVQNVLRYNPANLNYFVESPCFKRLKNILQVPPSSAELKGTPHTEGNFIAASEIVTILTDRDNPKLSKIQTLFYQAGILEVLVGAGLESHYDYDYLAPSSSVSSFNHHHHHHEDEQYEMIKKPALIALDGLLFCNQTAQDAFSKLLVNNTGMANARPTPAVLVAIKTAIDGGSDEIRLAATNMLGSYLRGNKDGQIVIVATFKSPILEGTSPKSSSLDEQSAGSMIIERAVLDLSLVRKDAKKIFFALIILSHVLRDNNQCKEIALSHKVTKNGDEELLFNNIISNLTELIKDPASNYVATSIASLILIATWACDHPLTVKMCLSEGSNVQFLMELINQNSNVHPLIQGCAAFLFGLLTKYHDGSAVSFSQTALEDIVNSRIGLDVFASRIVRTRDVLLRYKIGLVDDTDIPIDSAFIDLYLSNYQSILQLFTQKIAPSVEKSIEAVENEKSSSLSNDQTSSHQKTSHEKNVESKCAYLASENDRLQKLANAYSNQLIQIEKDHEELMVTLCEYEDELRKLRGDLGLAVDKVNDDGPPVNKIVEPATSVIRDEAVDKVNDDGSPVNKIVGPATSVIRDDNVAATSPETIVNNLPSTNLEMFALETLSEEVSTESTLSSESVGLETQNVQTLPDASVVLPAPKMETTIDSKEPPKKTVAFGDEIATILTTTTPIAKESSKRLTFPSMLSSPAKAAPPSNTTHDV